MTLTSFIFNTSTPVRAGKGALYVSNGHYLEPGRSLDEYELIFVRKGTLRVEEPDQSYDVEAGQTFILAPGIYHRCREMGREPLQQYWVRFTCPGNADQTESTKVQVPKMATIANPERIQQLWRMYTEEDRADSLSEAASDLLVTLLLCEVARADSVAAEPASATNALASRARVYIQEHYPEPISTSSIAHALDCNPNYLGRAFHKAYGMTVTDFLYNVRLYHAREALAYQRMSVTDIARLCGFGNRCYFRQVFVKREGMSPLAYRKLFGAVRTNF